LNLIKGGVQNLIGGALLTALHQAIDKFGYINIVVPNIALLFPLFRFGPSH
jgi:hypothetical protein